MSEHIHGAGCGHPANSLAAATPAPLERQEVARDLTPPNAATTKALDTFLLVLAAEKAASIYSPNAQRLLWAKVVAREYAALAALPASPEDGLDVERVAAFLHDEYGCRITCRGGRLADDRHPSHNEAYRGQAERLLATLDAALPASPEDGLPLGEPAMHVHDGLGLHRADQHHQPKDYRRAALNGKEPTP